MKLLIFFIILQFFFSLPIGPLGSISNFVLASEIANPYEVRLESWQNEQRQRKALIRQRLQTQKYRASRPTIKSRKKTTRPVKALRPSVSKIVVLPKVLPAKSETVIRNNLSIAWRPSEAATETSKANQTKFKVRRKMVKDSQGEFLANIPADNQQVQALLDMIDHTKVYFSINSDGRLSDLFTDERFREIYSEEMTQPTRKLTYHFFKGYQESTRNPNEPTKFKLNRDTRITREKVEIYLETTGIKSKLARSLNGSYPAPTPKPSTEIKFDTVNSSPADRGAN